MIIFIQNLDGLLLFFDNVAYLTRYGHNSCIDTWDSLVGGNELFSHGKSEIDNINEIDWIWKGTIEQLIYLADNKIDPSFTSRKIDKKDYDADHLLNVYEQIIIKHYKENLI